MMNIVARLIISVSIALLFFGCRGDRDNAGSMFAGEPEPEEYAVYSSLLEGKNVDSRKDKDDIIVIGGSTVPIPIVEGPNYSGSKCIPRIGSYLCNFDEKISIREIGRDTLADFEKKNRYPSTLDYQFGIETKYLLCSDEEYLELRRSSDHWKPFYTRYPYSHGKIAFSRVGFDRTRTKAVVYREWIAGSLSGGGRFIFLSKVNGGWIVNKYIPLWVS